MNIQLTEKQKILLRTAGMTTAVYLTFKYLIPLIIPFLIAILVSMPIRPAARYFYKKFHIPIGAAAGILLAVILLSAGGLVFWVVKSGLEQLALLTRQLPDIWEDCCNWFMDCCRQVESYLKLEDGTISDSLARFADLGEEGLGGKTLSGLLPGVMNTSVQGIKAVIEVLVTVFVTIGATLITTTQLEEIKKARDRSAFRSEINHVLDTLARVGSAYGKTQLVIMLLTMSICTAGLTLMRNPYAVLLGIVIGLLDALPLFGVGTVLWPWIAVSALSGNLWQTVGLALIYGACALTREIMEARYMGDRIGLSPLENLIAMYVGMQLFGLLGLFYGPIGYLLIKGAAKKPAGEASGREDIAADIFVRDNGEKMAKKK